MRSMTPWCFDIHAHAYAHAQHRVQLVSFILCVVLRVWDPGGWNHPRAPLTGSRSTLLAVLRRWMRVSLSMLIR